MVAEGARSSGRIVSAVGYRVEQEAMIPSKQEKLEEKTSHEQRR